MSTSLPAELAAFVQSEVAAGHYESADALLIDAVRLLQAERDDAIAGIKRGVESMRQGQSVPLDEAIADLRARHDLAE